MSLVNNTWEIRAKENFLKGWGSDTKKMALFLGVGALINLTFGYLSETRGTQVEKHCPMGSRLSGKIAREGPLTFGFFGFFINKSVEICLGVGGGDLYLPFFTI